MSYVASMVSIDLDRRMIGLSLTRKVGETDRGVTEDEMMDLLRAFAKGGEVQVSLLPRQGEGSEP